MGFYEKLSDSDASLVNARELTLWKLDLLCLNKNESEVEQTRQCEKQTGTKYL